MYCILFVVLFIFLSINSESGYDDIFFPRCIPTENNLDIIFVVDTSSINYVIELNLISDIIKNVLPINNSRVGLINFSGCTRKFTFKKCKQLGLLKKIISLEKNMEVIINAVNSLKLQLGILRVHWKITIKYNIFTNK